MNQTKKIVQKALELAYKKHYSNKVWVAPQATPSAINPTRCNDSDDDDVVFIREERVSGHPRPPTKLVGYEKKTRRGNKQWVGVGVKPSVTLRKAKVKTLSKNRKWEPGRESHLQSVAKKKWESSIIRRSLTRWRPPSVVSFDGGKYSVDPTGKRLKRLSLSSSSMLTVGGVAGNRGNGGVRTSMSGYLGTARSSFIKRKMAR